MFDELMRLRQERNLFRLLTHYVEATGEDREIWLDRLMELEKVSPKDLSKLHGELLAYSWLEQNTGMTPILRLGACPGAYRTTAAGRRAFARCRQPLEADDEGISEAA